MMTEGDGTRRNDEDRRVSALRRRRILDSPPEPAFDDVVGLAARLAGAPIAVLALADAHRIQFKSRRGIDVGEIDRSPGLFDAVIQAGKPLVVEDAREDAVAAGHPWVVGEPRVRFFAAAPLITSDGFSIGALAVLDREPRTVSNDLADALEGLARLAVHQIESRLAGLREIERVETESRQSAGALRASQARLRAILDHEPECVKIVSAEGILLDMNPAGLRLIEADDHAEAVGRPIGELIHPDDRAAFFDLHQRALRGSRGKLEFRVTGLKGSERWMETHSTPLREADGEIRSVLSLTRDVNERKRMEAWRDQETEILRLISSGAPLKDVLNRIAVAVDATVPGAISSILLMDEAGERLFHGAAPGLSDDFNKAVDGVVIGPNVGSCGAAAHRREPVIVADIEVDPLWDDYRDLARAHGLRACWSAPAADSRGCVAATSALYFREPRVPTAEDELLMLRVAQLVAIAVERARKDEELQRKQARLDMAMRISRVGAWELRLSDMRLTWSEITREVYEAAPDYVPNVEDGLNFYAPERRDVVEAVIKACACEGAPFDIESEIITAKGRRVRVRTLGEAVRSADGRIERIQGAIQDVTEIKRAEESRRESEGRFQQLAEAIEEVFWLSTPDGAEIFYISPAYETIWGRSREELYRNPEQWVEAVHEEDRQRIAEAALHQAEGSYHEEYRIVRPDGAVRWILDRAFPVRDAAGAVYRVAGTAKDVTAEKRAERNLRESEERFRLIAQATSDVVWDWNLPANRIWWSEGLRTLFGHDPAVGAAGLDFWSAHIHPADVDRAVRSIREAVEGNHSFWTEEYRFRRGDGSYAAVLDQGRVIRDADGRAVRMVGSMRDITERRRLEAQLRQSQRLEAVGQLTGGVAHDFNNLLTVILGNSELLLENAPLDPRSRRLAEVTKQAAEQGADLTNRLLAFGRRQALDPKPSDVNKLLGKMDGLLRRSLGEHVELESVRGGGLWQAQVDAAQLENAILNLAINARDAMPGGGKLTIETANTHLDDDYVVANAEVVPGQYVLIAVSDTGEGMPADVVARAFDPFFTTKAVGKGTGLGLSMVYGFVKQSRGHVKIYSEPGHGTTIRLYLPRAVADSEEAADGLRVTPLSRGSERILLVEDEDLVRAYVETQLRDLGYRVVAARNGREALDTLRADEAIDLLFTDVVMPGGMNGRVLADEAHKLRPALPVLFTSGYTDNAIIHHGRLDPGVYLLQKPFRRQELAAKVRQALDESPTRTDS